MNYFIILITATYILFGAVPSLPMDYENNSMANKEYKISKNDFEIIKNKSKFELLPIEAYMLGLWYFDGKKTFGIDKNIKLSNVYLKLSYDKGYKFASVHYLYTLVLLNKKNESISFLNSLLKNDLIETKLKIINLQTMINFLLENDDMEMAIVYIRYSSDKLNHSRAKIQFAMMYFEGKYIKQDKKLAAYYLNSGCNMNNLDDFSSSICNIFKRKKNE